MLLCYSTLVCAVLALVVTLVVLALVPTPGDQVQPDRVYNNWTVELQFSKDILWIHRMSMSVAGFRCVGKVLVIDGTSCSDFSQSHASSRVDNLRYSTKYVYLLRGSAVQFTVSEIASAYVWLFSSFEEAARYTRDPASFNCDDYPSMCFRSELHKGGQYSFGIRHTSYYFLRFSDLIGKGLTWTYNLRYYDYPKLSLEYTPRLTLTSEPKTLNLGTFFHYRTSCILVNMLPGSCFDPYGELMVDGITRRQDILVYPSILLFLVIVTLLTVSVGHCIYKGCQRRQ